MPNPGPVGNALTTLQEYLDDRKWLFFERGLMYVWEELYKLSQTANDPQQSILGALTGRYNYKLSSIVRFPPVLSRFGVPGTSGLGPP
jgi:hypothetical protein